ncbi:OpgC domain-containing protein [Candidatus Saccharibacteria bacterium TM7i]|nr:OpgC domain-containing protein [Candidatus Saccharibacteria bacterium TM7i]
MIVNPTKKKRLLYLDLIRGVLLSFIIINHVPYAPKITDIITGNGALISSAAEGFFLLSGLMVSYLYLPKILTNTKKVLEKVWKRAALLYTLSIATTLVFTLAAIILKTDPTQGVLYNGNIFSINFLQDLLSLSYIYGWTDFLARYAVFMLLAPAALFLIAYKKTGILIGISALIWFTSPSIGIEHFTAWQVLFVAGMIIGGKLDVIIKFFNNRKSRPYTATIFTVAALTVLWSTYVDLLYPTIISFHFNNSLFILLQNSLHIPYPLHDTLFSKQFMPILRVIISILWFTAVLVLFQKNEDRIKKYTGSFFSFLGQNSLVVYVIHSFVIFGIFIVFTKNNTNLGFTISTLIGFGAIAVVFGATKIFLAIKSKPRKFILRLTKRDTTDYRL